MWVVSSKTKVSRCDPRKDELMNFLMIEEIPAIADLESSEEDEQAAPPAGPPAKKVTLITY